MTTKDFFTPSPQNPSDPAFFRSDSSTLPSDPQFENVLNPSSLSRKKSHNPLNLSSTKFQAKGITSSPFFQDPLNTNYDSTDVTHSCVSAEPINGPSYVSIIEHLELTNFKTKPCPLNSQHNHKHCSFYHNAKDRKRVGFAYSAELCDYAEKDPMTCPNGEMCPKAHNRVEQLYRPDKYKTKFCTFYPNNLEKCDYGNFCSFAHSENDILIDLIHNYEYDDDFYMFHFKTVWCPFNLTQHDKALCVYAHNWQDYRRKPNVNSYEPSSCSHWKSTDFILNYEDGCPYKEKCNKCHGWKEHEYHPLNYKSKACPAGKNCAKGRDCPHYHTPRERRMANPNVANRIFRFVPRNRIITNTFKVRSEERPGPVYNMGNYSMNANQSSSTVMGTFPSLSAFSQENDSIMDQFSSMSEQYINNPSRNNVMNIMNDAQNNNFDFRSQKDDNDLKPRKHSFDFEPNRPRYNSSSNATNITPTEPKQYTQFINNNENNAIPVQSKIRRWSAHEEGGFAHESDRLFREIVLSSMNKEHRKPNTSGSPGMKNSEEKEENGDSELRNSLMLDKILESEGN